MAAIKVADLFARIGFRVDDRDLNKFEKNIGRAKQEVNTFGGALKKATGLLAGFFAIGAATDAVKSLFTVGAELDSVNNALFSLTGTAEGVQDVLGFLGSESDRLGLNLRGVTGSFVKLTAATKGTTLEGQAAKDLFTGVSEAATVLGLNSEQTKGSLTALEQIISKGKVSAEELRGQLGERLPGAFQIAARSIGKTTAELDKMLADGKLLAEDFIPQFTAQLRKEFGPGVAKAANSAQANFNRFSNAIFRFQTKIAQSGFLDVATEALIGVTEVLETLTPLAMGIAFAFKVVGVTFKALTRIITPTIRAIDKFIDVFQEMPLLVKLTGTALAGYVIATNAATAATLKFLAPFLRFATAFVAIPLIAEDLIVALKGGDSAIAKFAQRDDIFGWIAKAVLGFGEALGIIARFTAFVAAGAPGGFAAEYADAIGFVKELFNDLITSVTGWFNDLFMMLPVEVRGAMFAVGETVKTLFGIFEGVTGSIASLIDAFIKLITGDFTGFVDAIDATFGQLKETVLEEFTTILNGIKKVFAELVDVLPDFIKTKLGIEVVSTPAQKAAEEIEKLRKSLENLEGVDLDFIGDDEIDIDKLNNLTTQQLKDVRVALDLDDEDKAAVDALIGKREPLDLDRINTFSVQDDDLSAQLPDDFERRKRLTRRKIAGPFDDLSAQLPDDFERRKRLTRRKIAGPFDEPSISTTMPEPSISRLQAGPNIAPSISNSSTRQQVQQSTSVNVGGVTNNITVPQGTTQEQSKVITEKVNESMNKFFNGMLLDAQAEVPEMS